MQKIDRTTVALALLLKANSPSPLTQRQAIRRASWLMEVAPAEPDTAGGHPKNQEPPALA